MICTLCGHRCGVDRAENETGFCTMGETAFLSKVMLHKWEEPCISGTNGSGAIFFTGCSLRCAFCQNWEISHMRKGVAVDLDRLRDIFDELADQGAHNLNLVNPTHFVPFIAKAFSRYNKRIPVVYNTHGYDSLEALQRMDGIVDVYLPDLKYTYSLPARRYSAAPNYFEVAKAAIDEMFRQVGPVQYDENGLLKRACSSATSSCRARPTAQRTSSTTSPSTSKRGACSFRSWRSTFPAGTPCAIRRSTAGSPRRSTTRSRNT